MSGRQSVLLGVGLLSTCLGLGLAVTGALPASARPSLVSVLGLVAAAVALAAGYTRVGTTVSVGSVADRSRRSLTDAKHAEAADESETDLRGDDRVAETLRGLVARAITRSGAADDAAAERRLADGSWTDDPSAAALYADGVDSRRNYRDSARALRAGTTRLRYRIERAAAALRDRLGVRADDDAPAEREAVPLRETIQTERWVGFRAVPLAFVGAAVLAGRPALVFAGSVAVVALAVGVASRPPDPELTVTRTLAETTATHGDERTVRLAVRNDGDRTLFDCRIADGVPETLAVADGSPQVATALRPDATATVEYTVRATRGEHAFDPPDVVVTDAAGTTAIVADPAVTGDDTLAVSLPSVDVELPVSTQTTRQQGRIETDRGGDGVEFYATRDYQSGDPLSRVDWNRFARTRELSTVQFREEQAATVAVLVDARPRAYDAPENPELDTTVDRSVVAARGVIGARLAAEDRVGLASLSPRRVFHAPSGGPDHRSRLETALATDPAFGPTPAEGSFFFWPTFRWLRRELPGSAQVVCCSPLLDDQVAQLLRYLSAYGHAVRVVSPAPATPPTAEGTITAAEREFRLSALRRDGVPVVEWGHDESLASAIDRQEGSR